MKAAVGNKMSKVTSTLVAKMMLLKW